MHIAFGMLHGLGRRTSTGQRTLYKASTQSKPFSRAGRLL